MSCHFDPVVERYSECDGHSHCYCGPPKSTAEDLKADAEWILANVPTDEQVTADTCHACGSELTYAYPLEGGRVAVCRGCGSEARP